MNKMKALIAMSLAIFLVIGTGLASAQTAPPTVTKTAIPTDINVKGTGTDEITTITITVIGAGGITTTSVPMDVVFALDSSGSMSWNDASGLRKTASKSFVDKMDSAKDQAGVVSWDDNIDFTQALTNDFTLAKSRIDAVDSTGGTNLNVGLYSAIGVMNANTRTDPSAEVIIFLSNGAGTYTNAASGGPASDASSEGYVIYSIGLGPSPATGPLTDMATATGGKYYPSPTAANLQAIFDDILTEVTTSTIPRNVDVVEVTQSYIVDEGAFNIAPDSVTTDLVTGETTIIWNDIGTISDGDPDMSNDETVTLTFDAKCDQLGLNLDVDVYGDAKVKYDDKNGNPAGSVNIPQAKINVRALGVVNVESADVSGATKDTFQLAESVYAIGSGYAATTTYDLYILNDQTWSGGESLAGAVVTTTVTTDVSGNIPAGTLIWASAVAGNYDIVVDVDGNGQYDASTDALDDMDVNDAGFEAIPEFPTVALPVAAILGLMFLFQRRKD